MQMAVRRGASNVQQSLLGVLMLTLALQARLLPAQSVHAYKDASGQWVFTDRVANGDRATAVELELHLAPSLAGCRAPVTRSRDSAPPGAVPPSG